MWLVLKFKINGNFFFELVVLEDIVASMFLSRDT